MNMRRSRDESAGMILQSLGERTFLKKVARSLSRLRFFVLFVYRYEQRPVYLCEHLSAMLTSAPGQVCLYEEL
jgi:hypothetical protein